MFPTSSLEEAFIKNDRAKISSLTPLHQHFVTYQGVSTIYPSEDIPCEDNDIKQWYGPNGYLYDTDHLHIFVGRAVFTFIFQYCDHTNLVSSISVRLPLSILWQFLV